MLRSPRAFQVYSMILLALFLGVSLYLAIQQSDGHFIYPIDDIYIHLSLAETILGGGYGINSTEFASPSSSILYPFLLTLTTAIGLGEYGPMVLCVVPAFISMFLVTGLFWKNLHENFGAWLLPAFLLAAPVLIIALNGVALPLTGMEHALQVLGVCLVVIGLIRLSNDEGGLGLTVAGILLSGTIRFEGVALAGAGIVALVYLRHWKAAFVTGGILAAVFGSYLYAMSQMGLPYLPSSVLSKSGIAETLDENGIVDAIKGFRYTLERSLDDRSGLLIAIGALVLFVDLFRANSDAARVRPAIAVVIVALAAHLLAGRYGWFERYEVYVITALVLGFVAFPRELDRDIGGFASFAVVIGVLGVIASPFLAVTLKIPAASKNIFEQQHQMHRFATEYFSHNVAVNDLGWVSYQNDNYVLDLWGLGSETARKMLDDGGLSADETQELAEGRDIAFAMLFEIFEVPDDWCRIASLRTSKVIAAYDTVAFYLAESDKQQEMMAALEAFQPTLPDGAMLEVHGCS